MGCNLSIQGLFNKIPELFLQIQGRFYKGKVIFFQGVFKDRAVFPGVFQGNVFYKGT